tara:strand:- start:279 stop:890 length:612 start_codon:yes stop_codon:yes gene_type:complete
MNKKKNLKLPLKVGLTGSIGMGKTTVSEEVVRLNIPVWNADNVVHNLYKKNNEGYSIVKELVPIAAVNCEIDRNILSESLISNPLLLKLLEKKLKPFLDTNRKNFILKNHCKKILVFDIPLLFETRADLWLDKIIVVTAPSKVQKKRVMARKSMTEEKFEYLKSLQLSNTVKVSKADFVINTDINMSLLKKNVQELMRKIVDV